MLDKESKVTLPEPVKQSPWSPVISWVEIKDERGNVLQVPSLGSWTLNELKGIQELVKESTKDADFVYAAVRFFYKSRGADIDEQVGDLGNVPLLFVKEIWEFFQNENQPPKKDEDEQPGKSLAGKTSTGKSKKPTPTTHDSPEKPLAIAPPT